MLANARVAEAVPLNCGVKVTVKEAFWPTERVSGNVIPLTVNSELFDNAEETVTLPALALSVTVWLWFAPTTTLPKSTVAGETASSPWPVAVPDREILRFGSEASDTAEMVPVADPAEVGAKTTLNVILCPELSVCGRFKPLMLNADPDAVA